ncbi:M24 family metallopeptidase [Halorussus sp. AFM4]|uniref:M24 family metallopeptidase n=1 Tax=Halorussus sp. AFM4 TaxID=3421651 RepID=UPI003EBA379D
MELDVERFRRYLDGIDVDGYLIDADSSEPDQRYVSQLDAHDPFVTLFDGVRTRLLIWGSDVHRAPNASRADSVHGPEEYGLDEILLEHEGREQKRDIVAKFLHSHDISSVAVSYRFPTGLTRGLEQRGIRIKAGHDTIIKDLRTQKTDSELQSIKQAQTANEAAFRVVEDMLRESLIRDGGLYLGEDPLTADRILDKIDQVALQHDCILDHDPVLAWGSDAADPHGRSTGQLQAQETIVLDLGPRHRGSGYHSDMTRTFLKGEPSPEATEFHEVTVRALHEALSVIEDGVSGESVHEAVCNVFDQDGYPVKRDGQDPESGYLHYTGHGVGLDLHEPPHCSPGDETLEAGNVLSIEPGLYDPAVGGVRIEDLVRVTDDGCENLTDYHEEMVIP